MITPNLNDILNAESPEPKPEIKGTIESDFLPQDDPYFFSETAEPKTEVNLSDFSTPPPPPTPVEPIQPIQEKPRLPESEYQMNAELTVALYDGLQTLVLPMLYQSRIYTKHEKELLKVVKEKNRQTSGEVTYTEEEQKLLEKYMQVEELKKMVPFEEKEKELLITPLARIYSKYNVQVGPEFLLVSALLMVTAPRIMPLFNRFENSF